MRAGHDGLTPGAMVEELGVPYAKLGFHLKELTLAGLLTQEPAGRFVIYRAAYDRMDALLSFLTANCCQGVPRPVTVADADAGADPCGC